MPSPLAMIYQGEGIFTARSPRIADEMYGPGEVLVMAPVEERSEASHNHEFAWLKTSWETLPDHLAAKYPSVEHLRKEALINTGWCTVQDFACGTRAEALRWLTNLRKVTDEYTVILVENTVVRVFEAVSQSKRAMGKERFQKSKDDIIGYVAKLLETTPAQVRSAVAA